MHLPHRTWSIVASLVAFVACALLAPAAALAQDYTSSNVSGKYEAPPTTGTTNLQLTSLDQTTRVTLPFSFPYFGAMYSSIDVCSNGFLQIGMTTGSGAYSNSTFAIAVAGDQGMVAPYWDALNNAAAGNVLTWTKGTSPNRVFFVSWEGLPHSTATAATSLTFQVQLFEANGYILFAYKADSTPFSATTWGNFSSGSSARTSYSCGIQAPSGDARYVCPQGTSNNLKDHPPNDYQLAPKSFTYSGTLVMDRLVSDASGIGNTVQANVPFAGLPIELRRADGSLGFTGTTSATGAFSITTYGLNSATAGNGSLAVVARNGAAVVRTGLTGSPLDLTFKTNLPFSASLALGTVSIGSVADSNGEKRAPFNVALALQQARDWAAAKTTDSIPQLDLVYDAASSAASVYSRAAPPTSAWMRVASAAAANRDGWDPGMIRRFYARHVLASIAAPPSSSTDTRWDAVSDAENAFAEAFGFYLHAAVSGEASLVDGTGATTATVFDLEGPAPATRAGPDVTAWVAAALFDTLDGANETWDRIDGTGTPGLRAFQVVDSFTAPVTPAKFYAAWGAAGFAGADLSRDFIRHAMVPDDASEANDDVLEPASLGDVGVGRTGLALNLYNEDWFRVRLPSAAPAFFVNVSWDRLSFDTTVDLEIRASNGSLLAVAADTNRSKPLLAATGAVAAGDYLVRIAHKGGPTLPSYAVQAYTKLVLVQPVFGQWTAGKRFDLDLSISGGVPPYTITVPAGSSLPPGLTPDSAKRRISGNPGVAGHYSFGLAVTDSGSPASAVTTLGSMTVNPPLAIGLAPYTGFPLGHAVDRPGLVAGGTYPAAFSITAGGMPDGVTLDRATMRYVGTPTAAGATPFAVAGLDAAGSASAGSSVAVVCAPMLPAPAATPLAAGDAACGFFFDAVAGSRATVTVKTTPKLPRRTLKATVLTPSGAVLPAKVKAVAGAATVTGIACPESGRYYVILTSAAGDETELQAAVRIAPAVAGKARLTSFAPADRTDLHIGALAGARLTLTCSGDAKSRLKPIVVEIRDPSGAVVPGALDGARKTTRGFVLTVDLPASGTWTVVVGTDATASTSGTLSVSYKLKQPRGVTYSAD